MLLFSECQVGQSKNRLVDDDDECLYNIYSI